MRLLCAFLLPMCVDAAVVRARREGVNWGGVRFTKVSKECKG